MKLWRAIIAHVLKWHDSFVSDACCLFTGDYRLTFESKYFYILIVRNADLIASFRYFYNYVTLVRISFKISISDMKRIILKLAKMQCVSNFFRDIQKISTPYQTATFYIIQTFVILSCFF